MSHGTRTADMNPPLRVLAFESFDRGSHRQVREAIERHGRFDWRWLTRPGRAWKWRMRIGAADLALGLPGSPGVVSGERGEREEWGQWEPDVLFATSLLSLGDLVALLPRPWRSCPSVLYMHENQLAYPVREEFAAADDRDLQYSVTNLMSMLAADRILFNSRWNQESFLGGIQELLDRSPDNILNVEGLLRNRSRIAWPPVDVPETGVGGEGRVLHNAPVVVWPHRWEHDKGAAELLEMGRMLRGKGVGVKWILLGEQFPDMPSELRVFLDEFSGDILHAGRIDRREAYLEMLSRADWVLSTASHEFFGIAVVEAMLMGCLPWLPDRLSYPELVPAQYQGMSPLAPPDDPVAVRRAIRGHLEPCMAGQAVSRIESELEEAVFGDVSSRARGTT